MQPTDSTFVIRYATYVTELFPDIPATPSVSAVTEKVKLQIGVLALPIRNSLHIAKGDHIDLSARLLLRPSFCIYESLTRSMPPARHWPAGGAFRGEEIHGGV
ncbi:MAG: hypothetical protein HYY46_16930 [Deltaproteobacteria bacterium]|nr:hypothetical protein [Deltaproteobacteria bacterium]